MSKIDVRSINLNLLPALEALLVEGSVGGAARRVHISQSAMSHSLAKLREVFGDPLFVASGRAMVRTAVAERLAVELPAALDRLGDAVTPPAPFSAKTSRRVFRVATFDYFELTVMPDLLAHFSRHAPNVGLEVERFSAAHLPSLATGEIDLALLGESSLPMTGLRKVPLFEEPFAVIVRPDHPRVRRKLDLETYLELGHVLVSIEGRRDAAVDRALQKIGRTRNVVVRVPHFTAAPLAVLRSDHVSTIARSVALRAKELFGLRVLPVPLPVPAPLVVAYWSRRTDGDEGALWFRNLLIANHAPEFFDGLLRAGV